MVKTTALFVLVLSCLGTPATAQTPAPVEGGTIVETFDPCLGNPFIPESADEAERDRLLAWNHRASTHRWSIEIRKLQASQEVLMGLLVFLGTEGFFTRYINHYPDSIVIHFYFDPSSFHFGGDPTRAYRAKEAAFKEFAGVHRWEGVFMDCSIPPAPED